MITKAALLPCSVERAFELFTEHASEWWPPERRHTRDPASEIRILASGRFWERDSQGREVELGRVRVWEPPTRIVLDWYPGTDADHPTEVIVSFAAEGASTRITIEHRPLPESKDLWPDRLSRYVASWDLVLEAFASHATRLHAR
jgi:uncharacterized protein YndB with AHSA1/START domain